MNWNETTANLVSIFHKMEITDKNGQKLDHDCGFGLWLEIATHVRQQNGYLFLIGNGASSSMASHFATDITKNGKIKTHVFTDASLLSAIGNDYCFDELYARPLQWYSSPEDLLIAISSSGNSANIVQACLHAKKSGLKLVTLSAMSPDNRIRTIGDINFYINAQKYGLAESGHAVILHHWMDLLESSTTNQYQNLKVL